VTSKVDATTSTAAAVRRRTRACPRCGRLFLADAPVRCSSQACVTAAGGSVRFQLRGLSADITRRAAAALALSVVEEPDGTFRVELRQPTDAYHLGVQTSSDRAWARVFLEQP